MAGGLAHCWRCGHRRGQHPGGGRCVACQCHAWVLQPPQSIPERQGTVEVVYCRCGASLLARDAGGQLVTTQAELLAAAGHVCGPAPR